MIALAAAFAASIALSQGGAAMKPEPEYELTIFDGAPILGPYYHSSSKTEGGAVVKGERGRLPVTDQDSCLSARSLVLDYQTGEGAWTATIRRQAVRGQDHFKPASRLALNIRVQNASKGPLPLVSIQSKKWVNLERYVKPAARKGWQRVSIPLGDLGISPGRLSDGEAQVSFKAPGPGSKGRLLLSEVALLPETPKLAQLKAPTPPVAHGSWLHVDLDLPKADPQMVRWLRIWRAEGKGALKPIGVQKPEISRFTDFVGKATSRLWYAVTAVGLDDQESPMSAAVPAKTNGSPTDDQLMTMVQEACFRYYWDGAEQASGLAKENIPGRVNMVASGASGFGVMALLVGTERGFITRKQAVSRFKKIVSFLQRAEKFHGAFSHFIDGPTGKVEPFFGPRDNGADLVETSFLFQGLLAARNYFDRESADERSIREGITKLWEGIEWDWFRRTPDGKYLIWHWSPDQEWVINHHLIGWNEVMSTYLLAICSPSHGVPASMYYTGWASQEKMAQEYRYWGRTDDGQMYSNGKTYFGHKLDVGVSNGGPLFFTHYSFMGFDPHGISDRWTNYFHNNATIARINHDYCVANPKKWAGYGPDAWGLTASDGPNDYSADEPVDHADIGKITPTGAVASMPYTPKESLKALRHYYQDCGSFLWGEYGFRDSYLPAENWCSPLYMGLNQAPMVVMMENHRTGLIWKTFMKDKDVRRGLAALAQETRRRMPSR